MLAIIWLVALVLSFFDTITVAPYWDRTNGYCDWRGDPWIEAVSILTTFAVCLACYTASSFRVRQAGLAVQRAVWRRAQWYLLVVLVFTMPMAAYDVMDSLDLVPPPIDGIASDLSVFVWLQWPFELSHLRFTK